MKLITYLLMSESPFGVYLHLISYVKLGIVVIIICMLVLFKPIKISILNYFN